MIGTVCQMSKYQGTGCSGDIVVTPFLSRTKKKKKKILEFSLNSHGGQLALGDNIPSCSTVIAAGLLYLLF